MKLRPPRDAIDASNRIAVLPDEYYNQIPRQYRSLAFTISGLYKISAIRLALESLQKAFKDGQNFNQWRAGLPESEFGAIMDFRLRTVFQTYVNTANNQGTIRYARDNKDRRPYLRYSTVGDSRVRPNHAALDGLTRPVDDPFWNVHTAPLGFNCRCQMISMTKVQIDRGGTRTSPTQEKPTGSGVTPTRIMKDVIRLGRPDRGFTHSKVNALTNATRLFRSAVTKIPIRFRKLFLDTLLRRERLTDIWYNRSGITPR